MAPIKKASSATSRTRAKRATGSSVAKQKPKKAVAAKPLGRVVKPKRKGTIVDSFKKQERKPFSFPTKISLSIIPAINQLPINPDLLAIGLARYGGIAVVTVGAFFSLYFIHALGLFMPGLHIMASVADGILQSNTVTMLQTMPVDSTTSISTDMTESAAEQNTAFNFMLLTASLFVVSIGMTLLILAEYLDHVRPRKANNVATT